MTEHACMLQLHLPLSAGLNLTQNILIGLTGLVISLQLGRTEHNIQHKLPISGIQTAHSTSQGKGWVLQTPLTVPEDMSKDFETLLMGAQNRQRALVGADGKLLHFRVQFPSLQPWQRTPISLHPVHLFHLLE